MLTFASCLKCECVGGRFLAHVMASDLDLFLLHCVVTHVMPQETTEVAGSSTIADPARPGGRDTWPE
jgi:hypothetical protein